MKFILRTFLILLRLVVTDRLRRKRLNYPEPAYIARRSAWLPKQPREQWLRENG